MTAASYYGDDADAPVWVDWCGIAIWKHKNANKYFRNWMVGQTTDEIGERGQGFSVSHLLHLQIGTCCISRKTLHITKLIVVYKYSDTD